MLLNDAEIRAAKASEKNRRLKDGGGLFLVVRPTGKKFWQFRYRYLEKEKSLSLGSYPEVSLSMAREKRIDARRNLMEGKDPSSERRKDKKKAIFKDRNSFESIAKEWHERNIETWTADHGVDIWSRLSNHLLPKIGARPITEIEPLDILDVLYQIESMGKVHMARSVLQISSSVFNYAILTGRAKYNITIGLSKALKKHKVKHYPALEKQEFPDFLRAIEIVETSEQNRIAIKLLIFTALRTGELRYSRWQDVDLRRLEWHIPAENTKMRTEHIVPLSSQAIQLLEALNRISGEGEWLFPNQQGRVHPVMSENTINHIIARMGYKGRIVGHGFRSMFSTISNEHGFNRDAIERQLAHMERNKVRAAYNRAEYMEQRREIMQWWADFLDLQKRVDKPHEIQSTATPAQYQLPPSTLRVNHAYQAFYDTASGKSLH